jgi:hypothetical protein
VLTNYTTRPFIHHQIRTGELLTYWINRFTI